MRNAKSFLTLILFAFASLPSWASEADLKMPDLSVAMDVFGYSIPGTQILYAGILICLLGMVFGLFEFMAIKRLPAHKKMLDVSKIPGDEIIHRDHTKSFLNKSIAQMRAKKTCATSN